MTRLRVTQASHVGGRLSNEDSLLVMGDRDVLAVADGLGGHEGGEIASDIAVTAIEATFRRRVLEEDLTSLLREAVAAANACIVLFANEAGHEALRGMASTIAVFARHPTDPGVAAIAWAGDSRVYRMRGGRLEQLTEDHVVKKPMLSRCLGARLREIGDLRFVDVLQGDVFLLCTDGLTDALDDRAIERILRAQGEAQDLVRAALATGDPLQDNVTAIVARV
jgi:serine/threonine protein phosphatase PrpC